MKHVSLILVLFCLTGVSPGEILVKEDFEDEVLSARGWTDIAKWGADRSLYDHGPAHFGIGTAQHIELLNPPIVDFVPPSHRLQHGVPADVNNDVPLPPWILAGFAV